MTAAASVRPQRGHERSSSRQRSFLYNVDGVRVRFPYRAYHVQIAFMQKLIAAFSKAENALVESPTGTGKTCMLLCAALAWRESLVENSYQVSPNGSPTPTIIYASRTHSQLAQVVAELRKLPYKVRATVLGSREQLCLNVEVRALQNSVAMAQSCREKVAKRLCVHHSALDARRSALKKAITTGNRKFFHFLNIRWFNN